MRSVLLALLAAGTAAACTNPVTQQAMVDTRHDPVRADTMLAVGFTPGVGRLDAGQANEVRAMVEVGRHAQRDEFVVVTDGSGGPIQQARAQQVMRSLSDAGARWVGTTVEPAMAMGPDQVVVVRSEYRIAERNCPNYNPANSSNTNEASMPGFGCGDAYNFGQMLARPRDAAGGQTPGPADATVNAAAIQRYREGRVRTASTSGGSSTGGTDSGSGAAGGGGSTSTGGASGAPAN